MSGASERGEREGWIMVNWVYIYISYLLHESECDMAKYLMSKLIYFHEPEASENKALE